jgi:hypothetical protein
VAVQSKPQISGAWDCCGGCGKPIIPDGLGTALKPAYEPIIMARKPLSEGTVAANVLEHGTGAINVDGCRVPGIKPQVTQGINSNATSFNVTKEHRISGDPSEGRWPANVILDDRAGAMLDEQRRDAGRGDCARPRPEIGVTQRVRGFETSRITAAQPGQRWRIVTCRILCRGFLRDRRPARVAPNDRERT